MRKYFLSILLLNVLLFGCIEPYDPPQISNSKKFLVVDGQMDVETGKAVVNLSTIRNLSVEADTLDTRISGATVTILINGSEFPLTESEKGSYSAEGLIMHYNDICQLIFRHAGDTYETAEVSIRETPEIDSVTYTADETGVELQVTTHDPQNDTHYYQWQFEETAEYTSTFFSNYYYDGTEVRPQDPYIYRCWKESNSTNILVSTSEGLSEDVIYKFPVIFLPADSWKKRIRYSALIKQYAISKEAFTYWKELEKNSENVGSLFDPQPAQVVGNISNVDDPSEQVLGYFSVRSVRTKRIFIDANDLPKYPPGIPDCSSDNIDTLLNEDLYTITRRLNLINAVTNMTGAVLGYTTGPDRCQDCRLVHGGSIDEPDYWEE